MKKWVKPSSALSWALREINESDSITKIRNDINWNRNISRGVSHWWLDVNMSEEEVKAMVESKKRIMIKAVSDGCTIGEARKEWKVRNWIWDIMLEDMAFVEELEFAVDSDIRLAKSKIRLGLEKDDCEEFALKYLKAKLPNEYWSQSINMTHWVKGKEDDNKSVDEMLIQYYQE